MIIPGSEEMEFIKKQSDQQTQILFADTIEGKKMRDKARDDILRSVKEKNPKELESVSKQIDQLMDTLILQTPEGEKARDILRKRTLEKLTKEFQLKYKIEKDESNKKYEEPKIEKDESDKKDKETKKTPKAYKFIKIGMYWLIIISINILLIYFGIINIIMNPSMPIDMKIGVPIIVAVLIAGFDLLAIMFYRNSSFFT